MEASRVTISPETLQTQRDSVNSIVGYRKRKTILKDESIKTLVRNTPAGKGLTASKLMSVAGYDPTNTNSYQAGMQYILGAIRRGVIVRVDPSEKTFKKQYFVPDDVHTVNKQRPRAKATDEEKKLEIPGETLAISTEVVVDVIVAKAKQFAWEHNSDSLREFIATLQ